jgi:hypothetical protein
MGNVVLALPIAPPPTSVTTHLSDGQALVDSPKTVLLYVSAPLNKKAMEKIRSVCDQATKENPVRVFYQGCLATGFNGQEVVENVLPAAFNDAASQDQQFAAYLTAAYAENPYVSFVFFTTALAKGDLYQEGFRPAISECLKKTETWKKMSPHLALQLLWWYHKGEKPSGARLVEMYEDAMKHGWHGDITKLPAQFDTLMPVCAHTNLLAKTTEMVPSKMVLLKGWPTVMPLETADSPTNISTLVHRDPAEAGKLAAQFLERNFKGEVGDGPFVGDICRVTFVQDFPDVDNPLAVVAEALLDTQAKISMDVVIVGVPIEPEGFSEEHGIASPFHTFGEFKTWKTGVEGTPGTYVSIPWRKWEDPTERTKTRRCTIEEMEKILSSAICPTATALMTEKSCDFLRKVLQYYKCTTVEVTDCGHLPHHPLSTMGHANMQPLFDAVALLKA